MSKQNGGIIGPDNVTTGGFSGVASGVFKLGEVTKLIRENKWPEPSPFTNTVPNSARFNDGSSDYLNRATSDPQSSNTTATYSVWIKRSALGSDQCIWSGSYYDNNNIFQFKFLDSDKLSIYSRRGSSTKANLTTSQVFRDTSAWYHIVVAIDTTQGTEANRIKCYVNGELATVTGSYPSVNENLYLDAGAGAGYYIGRRGDSAEYFDGYIAEFVYVDGQQLAPTSFGETNSDSGIWIPKSVSGLTFGTKGLYLDFKDSSALGNDANGSNNFTVNNLTSIDQSTDSPSNNFATLNELATSSYNDLSDGSLTATGNTATNDGETFSTFVMPNATSKWYWEIKCINKYSDGNPKLGFTQASRGFRLQNGGAGYGGGASGTYDIMVRPDGKTLNNGSTSGSAVIGTWGTGDTLSFALDSVNGAFYVGINNTWQTSGNPTSGASRTGAVKTWSPTQSGDTGALDGQAVCIGSYNGSVSSINFGNPPYAISSGNADANGFGNFEYAPPTGYFSLCTNNLNILE